MTNTNGERVADGLRVVEVGSSASVAMAGLVMADAGAEVVLVEAPGGSPLREQAAFPMWARGKHSLVADLGAAAGRARVAALAAEADVVLIGLKPASADRFGLDYDTLSRGNPRLVHTALSAFGSKGPARDVPYYDGTMEAKAGRMWEFSVLHGGERPGFAASPVLAHAAAMLILQGTFGALHERLRTGRGQRIETSLAQAYGVHDLIRWPPGGSMDLRTADVPFIPYTVARTRDGVWLQFAQNGPALFNDFMRALGLEGLGDYGEVMQPSDPEATRGVRARILERIGERTWEEWQAVFANERNVSAELFWAPGDALDHPQFQAMGDVLEIDDPAVGKTRQLGPLVEWKSLPSRPSGPAPALGSLGDAGFRSEKLVDAPAAPDAPQAGVLSGVTVVEFATWIATPFAASLLADLGARVIKVEPLAGDPMRSTGPAIAMKMMQGKESLCLDLKAPEAKEIVQRLVGRADAMLHSYRPGVPERLGLDFDTLRAINPRLVHLYNGSYGSRGPKAFAAAFHVTGGAVAGGCFAQAGEGVPPPADQPLDATETARIARHLELANEANPDFNSAVAAAAAACMGLYASAKRGEALELETRMMLSNAYMMSPWFVDSAQEKPALPDAELNGQSPLYRLYEAREGWVFLSTPMQRDFERLCTALDAPEIAEAFGDAAARRERPDALAAALGAVFRTRDASVWEQDLTGQGVSCVRADIGPFARWGLEEPWVREAGLVCDVAESELGGYPRYAAEVTTERPVELRGGFPAGQETHAILSELGYSRAEVSALLASGAVVASG